MPQPNDLQEERVRSVEAEIDSLLREKEEIENGRY